MYGRVMELVDMRDSKFLAFGRGGSSPPSATTYCVYLVKVKVKVKAIIAAYPSSDLFCCFDL